MSDRHDGTGPDARARTRPAPMADAIRGWLGASGVGQRVAQASVVIEWPMLVGEQIASVTEAECVTPDGLLRVRVATAAWANELSLMTPQIMARLNAGRTARIRGIRWIAGGHEPGTKDPYRRRGHGT
jgi:predicted nucleic acid-binding Zn ribbon protein